jgi:hypothetical protein
MLNNKTTLLVLSILSSILAPSHAREIKSVEEWTFSSLKGTNTYFAAYKDPSEKTPPTEEQRAAMRRAIIDNASNSNIPFLPSPARMEDGISNTATVTVGLFNLSRDDPELPKGAATVKYTDGLGSGEDQYLAWRSTHLDTYMMISDKTTYIYTVHRNVRHPDGGNLLTLVTIRNNMIGVSSYTMIGSARRRK